jgi:hypothetical protein
VEEEHVLPEVGYLGIAVDALAVVIEREELDVAGEPEDGPGALAQHGVGDCVGLGHELVALGHALGHHRLEPAEELLVLQLLVGEAHERLEDDLVAQGMRSGDVDQLRADESLHEAEHVGVGASLDLADEALLAGGREREASHRRETVGNELAGIVEIAAADHVAVDLPAHLLRSLDAPGVTGGAWFLDCGIHLLDFLS